MTAKQFVERLNSMIKDDPGFRRKPGALRRGCKTNSRVAILVTDDASYSIPSDHMWPMVSAILARASIQGHQQMPPTQSSSPVPLTLNGAKQESTDGETS